MTYANLAAVTAFFDRYDETNAWARTNHYGDDSNPIVEVITGQDLIVGTRTQGNPPEWTFNYSGTSGTSSQTRAGRLAAVWGRASECHRHLQPACQYRDESELPVALSLRG